MSAAVQALRGKRAVLLDALGTLVELVPPAPALVRALERRLGLAVTERDAERAIGAEIAYYRGHLDEGRDAASLAELRRRCARVMGEALVGGAGSSELEEEALTAALMESLRFRAYPDAPAALSALRERGLRLVVVSNWDVSLPEVLERVGLRPALDAVVTSAAVGARKPAPEIFQAGLRAAGVAAAEALHVGDGPEEDLAGARAAGIDALLIARHRAGGRPATAAAIASLAELAGQV